MATYHQQKKTNLNKKTLVENDDFLYDARLFLIDRGGLTAKDLQDNETVYNEFMEHFRAQNVNEITASRDLIYAQTQANDIEKARMGRLMHTFDNMDSDFGWKAAGDYLEGVFTAPSTYAGIFSFGAGKAGAIAANQGIKFGIRQALKSGGLRAGASSVAVDATASAGTIAAQEQTRVETIEGKDAIDWGNVGTGAVISTVASGGVGVYTGTRQALLSYGAENIAKKTLKKEKDAILEAHKKVTTDVFDGASKNLTKEEAKLISESAINFKKKLSLEETIPEGLEKGKKLKKEIEEGLVSETTTVKTKGLGVTLDEKHIENISAAGARIYHLIEPRSLANGKKVVKGSTEDLQERFTSRIHRGVVGGGITTESLAKILKDHSITMQELGYLYAEDISSAARILGKQGILKKKLQKQFQKELLEIDEALMSIGSDTSVARKKLKEKSGIDILGSTGNVIKHLDKARIGFMTIQLATTARNTTNGFMRNYVYALDNLGAGLFNVAKGSINKIKKTTDKEAAEEAIRAVRMGQMQLRNGVQALFLDDLRLGTTKVTTQALTRLFTDDKFGKSSLAKELFREMGDIGNISGTEGGLIGAARWLNGLNTKSDNMFKRAIFSRELDKIVYAETGQRLEDVLQRGSFKNISDKAISRAMDSALDFTYQTGKFKGKGGGFNAIFDTIIKVFSTPGLSLAVPFPRYLVNQFRFIYEHTPVLGMINIGGILNKTDKIGADTAEKIGKQLGGLTTLYAFLQMRSIHGDESTGALEYNSPDIGPLKGNGYYDARASLGPFSAFAVAADYMYKVLPNLDDTTFKLNIGDVSIDTFIKQNPRIAKDVGYSSRDLVYAFTGGQGRGGTGLQFIDSVLEAGLNGINLKEDQYKEAWVVTLADAINSATVGAGVIKDLVSAIDPDFRKIPDNTDVSLIGYFMKQATRSFPQTTDPNVDGLLGYTSFGGQRTNISESPTRTGGKTIINPLLKQFSGLSEQEEKNIAERELKRLNLDFFEYSPRRIKLDPSLSNEAKGIMANFMDKNITSYLKSKEYNSIPTDFEKRIALKQEIYVFRTEARDRVLNPNRASNQKDILRIHRAMFYDLPKDTQKWLGYMYRKDLKNDGWTRDKYEDEETSITGNIAKDDAFIWSFSFLEKLKNSDTKTFEYYTRPTVSGVPVKGALEKLDRPRF